MFDINTEGIHWKKQEETKKPSGVKLDARS